MVTLVEEYPVGTTFLKSFLGYGVWVGTITSFDGLEYDVVYDDGFIESFDCDEMDEIMLKSDRLRAKNVKVATAQTARQTTAVKLGDESSDKPLENGQHVHSKRVRTQTLTYTEEMGRTKNEEPMMRGEELGTMDFKRNVKTEELLGGEDAKKMPATRPRKSTTRHYHDGFKFTLHRSNGCLPYDVYWCSSRQSTNCPMKLRVNRETGAARAYTSFGESLEHCNMCKLKIMKAPGASEAACAPAAKGTLSLEARERAVAFLNRSRGGRRGKSAVKREVALRGWETRRKNIASLLSAEADRGRLKQESEGSDSQSSDEESTSEPRNFEEGQHVWVTMGKASHPAVIESFHDDAEDGGRVARVRWSTMNTIDEVEVDQLSLMFEGGKSATSTSRKRKRKETDRFKPPLEQRKRVKSQETPSRALELIPKQKTVSRPTNVKRKAAVKEESADFVRENLDAFVRVPAGLAPGPGWTSKLEFVGRDRSKRQRRWISPREGIVFKHPKAAFEFEAIRLQCNGDERQALESYVVAKRFSGEAYAIANRGKLSRRKVMIKRQTAESRNKVSSMKIKEQEEQLEEESYHEEEDAMTLAQVKEYETLWAYYLKPSTRENEEIPSGMVLRKREASCNLLRYKDSVFRQKAHSTILRLERWGRKAEIYRILKALHDHDISMDSGDGPAELLDEILGQDPIHGDVEVLGDAAVAELQASNAKKTGNEAESKAPAVDEDETTCREVGCLAPAAIDESLGAEIGKVSVSEMEQQAIELFEDEEEGQDEEKPPTAREENSAMGEVMQETSPDSIDQTAINSCGDDASELDQQLGSAHQAVQDVSGEWIDEGTTTSATSASSSSKDTSNDNDCEMRKDGTSSNTLGGDVSAAAVVEKTRQEVIDLCGDDGVDDQGPEVIDLSQQIEDVPAGTSNEVIVLD